MFTLGNKEAIVNATSKYPITVNGTLMTIEGFGTFEQSQIISALGQRFIGESFGSLAITCPSASDIGLAGTDVRIPVVAHIRVNTIRHSSEWATDFIKRGRPFVFELNLDGSDSATDVADKLAAAMAEYELKFEVSELPWTTVNDGAGELTLTLIAGELNFQETVTFLRKTDTFGLNADTTKFVPSLQADNVTPNLLAAIEAAGQSVITFDSNVNFKVGDVILIGDAANPGVEGTAVEHQITAISTANTTDATIDPVVPAGGYVDDAIVTVRSSGDEATNDGKYLEENVRMSTWVTSDSYEISPDEKPIIANGYTQIKWTMRAIEGTGIGSGWAPHKHLSTTAADAKVGERDMDFSLYFNEDATLETGGPVDDLVTFLIGGTPVITDFKLANGEGAPDVATFIA
jgi:hypothetical protein